MTVGTPDWAEQLRRARDGDVTPHRQSMRRMGDSVRQLIERLMATTAPREALEEAADAVDGVCRRLAAYPGGRVPEGFAEAANSGDPHAFFDNSPQIGRANPLAPPILIAVDGDLVVGQVVFGSAYEGPPGCVHGGHVAAAFDEVLGMAQSLTGKPGMTGSLNVHYRRPTPLFTELRYEARVDRIEGRKIFTTGRSFNGDELTAEAEAVFVRIDFQRIADLYDKRRRH